MKYIIDIEIWECWDNYNFFCNFYNLWIFIISEVDCIEVFLVVKVVKCFFFLYYLYVVLCVVNEVKEFCFCIDKNGQVVYYDQVDIILFIVVFGKIFYIVCIFYYVDFEWFYVEVYYIVYNIFEEGDLYGVEKVIIEQGDFDII